MNGSERLLLSAAVVVLLAGTSFDLYEFTMQGTTSSSGGISSSNGAISTFLTTGFVTGTSVTGASDTFYNQDVCPAPGGGGGFELRVVSDSAGAPVSGETINAVGMARCIPSGGVGAETQVVYIDKFSAGQGGWLTPNWPVQADNVGDLNFTVNYQGRAYNLVINDAFPPIGTNCVTLHIPSGNVTRATAMNGIGSYCFQG
jgi:hypothetical protein